MLPPILIKQPCSLGGCRRWQAPELGRVVAAVTAKSARHRWGQARRQAPPRCCCWKRSVSARGASLLLGRYFIKFSAIFEAPGQRKKIRAWAELCPPADMISSCVWQGARQSNLSLSPAPSGTPPSSSIGAKGQAAPQAPQLFQLFPLPASRGHGDKPLSPPCPSSRRCHPWTCTPTETALVRPAVAGPSPGSGPKATAWRAAQRSGTGTCLRGRRVS